MQQLRILPVLVRPCRAGSGLAGSVLLGAVVAVALAFGALGVSTVHAADTLNGEILDLACYIGRGAKGPAHTRCAQTCAEHGMPLGLLSEDDKVYVLYPKHGKEAAFEAVKELAGKDATLTGKKHEKDGMLGMEVHSAVPLEEGDD